MRAIYVERVMPKMIAVKALRPAWSGVIWSPLSPATVSDLPEPELPGSRWVRVRNHQCGICATDLSLLMVKVDPAIAPAALPGNNRFYLGHEVVSTVEEVGSGVTRFKPGDRVLMDTRFSGAHCLSQEIDIPCVYCQRGEFGLCENMSLNKGPRGIGGGWGDGYTAHETEIYPVPDDIDDDQATLVEPMAVAVHAALRRALQPNDHVLVVGGGMIGLLTVQATRGIEPDCHITLLARYPHQAEAGRRMGADEIMSGSNLYEHAAEITGAKYYSAMMNNGMLLGGFDVIYDCVGNARTIEDSLRWCRAGGTLVVVGIDLSRIKVDLNPVWYQEVDLIGSKNHGCNDWRGERRHTYEWVYQFLREGKMTHEGLITHRFPLDQYKRAIAAATNKRDEQSIKVVFDCTR